MENKQESHWESEEFPSGNAFAWIFNYRVQAMSYDGSKPIEISKKQNFAYWETGVEEGGTPSGWTPFLSGETGDKKDMFKLKALMQKPADVIKSIKCTITKGTTKDCAEECAEYKDIELKPSVANGETYYYIGRKANEEKPSFEFKENYYKIVVKVEYKDTAAGEDTFTYILNYTDTAGAKIELMGASDEVDVDTNLFGVLTSYGAVKMLDADSFREIANMRGLVKTAM